MDEKNAVVSTAEVCRTDSCDVTPGTSLWTSLDRMAISSMKHHKPPVSVDHLGHHTEGIGVGDQHGSGSTKRWTKKRDQAVEKAMLGQHLQRFLTRLSEKRLPPDPRSHDFPRLSL